MAINLISHPKGDAESRYFPVNNPIEYIYQSDIGIGGGAYNSYSFTAAQVGVYVGSPYFANVGIMPAGGYPYKMRVGDLIFIGNNIVRVAWFGVGIGGVSIIINRPLPYMSYVQVRSIVNYYAEFRVVHGRKEREGVNLVSTQVGGVFSATPGEDGMITLNVQPFLKPFVDLKKTDLSVIDKSTTDKGVWGRFAVQHRERFDGDGKAIGDGWIPAQLEADDFRWWFSGVRQQGNNMMLVNTDAAYTGARIKLLSAFVEPEYYIGYPNEVSFLWPDFEDYYFLIVRETKLNATKQPEAIRQEYLHWGGVQELNRIRIATLTELGVSVQPGHHLGFISIQLTDELLPELPPPPPPQPLEYVEPAYVTPQYIEQL